MARVLPQAHKSAYPLRWALSVHIDGVGGLDVLLSSKTGPVIAAAACDMNAHTTKHYQHGPRQTIHHRAPIRSAAGNIVWAEDVKPAPTP